MENISKQHFVRLRNSKFLRRTLELLEDDSQVLAKAKLKLLCLKKLTFGDLEEIPKYYAKRKHLVCLRNLNLKGCSQEKALKFIKSCKTLKNLLIDVSFYISLSCTILKRLPKNIETIKLVGAESEAIPVEVRCLYKILAGFRKLKVLSTSIDYHEDEKNCVQKENGFINKYISKLNFLKEFSVKHTDINQLGFQRIMKQDQGCPYITDLSVQLAGYAFMSFYAVQDMLKEEKSQADDKEDWIDNLDAEEQISEENYSDEIEEAEDEDDPFRTNEEKIQAIKTEIVPFFKFNLFPNLRKLNIRLFGGCLYPFDSYVIEGFKALIHLEQLNMSFECRPPGTGYFFESLAHLPLLIGFNLQITFIKEKEYLLLDNFLRCQTQLISLALDILDLRKSKSGYQAENFFIENISLNDKPQLKYLALKSVNWTAESLSNGLEKTANLSELQELDIEIFDDHITSTISSEKRVKGLCGFLRRQKRSLCILKISISFVTDDVIMDTIFRAISELKDLRVLYFSTTREGNYNKYTYKKFFKTVFGLENPKQSKTRLPRFENTFLELKETLLNLKHLSELNIKLITMSNSKEETDPDSSVVFDALAQIKSLKKVDITLPFLKDTLKNNIDPVDKLFELKNVTYLVINTKKKYEIKRLQRAVEVINRRQSLKCELMF